MYRHPTYSSDKCGVIPTNIIEEKHSKWPRIRFTSPQKRPGHSRVAPIYRGGERGAMSPEGSITQWIHQRQGGNSSVAEALWGRDFPKLVQLAKEKLQGLPSRMTAEEDVALSAMNRFFCAAQENRYPHLADRDELWRLPILRR
jgi:hypothetical protein